MKASPECVCTFCERVFCCEKCRTRHELTYHSDDNLELIECPVCNGNPLQLNSKAPKRLIEHIVQKHLPLQCYKCNQFFTRKEDFIEWHKCRMTTTEIIKEKSLDETFLIKKCSPIKEPIEDALQSGITTKESQLITPLSKLMWRYQNQDSISFESSSCNTSAANIIRRPLIHPKVGKLVRSTSTPTNLSNGFSDTSSCQMSSIHSLNSDTDGTSPVNTESKKVIIKSVHKKAINVTPLRQVMSKSIQRAIMKQQNGCGNRRIEIEQTVTSIQFISPGTPPLDLRTTPVLKRDGRSFRCRELPMYKKDESKFETLQPSPRKEGNSVQAAKPLEESNETETFTKSSHSNQLKTVYETSNESLLKQNDEPENHNENDEECTEIWGTPMKYTSIIEEPNHSKNDYSKQSSFHCSSHTNTFGMSTWNSRIPQSTQISPNKILVGSPQKNKTNSESNGGSRLWDFVSRMIKFANFPGINEKLSKFSIGDGKVKRCNSFAGYSNENSLNRKNSYFIEETTLKRRRSTITSPPNYNNQIDPISKKFKRIHGRPAIRRLRQNEPSG